MSLHVKSRGLETFDAQLAGAGRKLEAAMRGALNTTATKARAERYVRPLSGTFAAARVRRALRVKRANSRRMESRIIPSSSGVLVIDYKTWGFAPIDATRARVWVRSPFGRKIAAGFVNPSSARRLPWSTRSEKARALKKPPKYSQAKTYRYETPLGPAMGPSTAYWFKRLSDRQTLRWVEDYLQAEFERRAEKEMGGR